MAVIILALRILFDLCILYTVYKLVWYMVVMTKFILKLNRLNKNGTTVEFKRSFFGMIFGKRGECDFVIKNFKETVAVSVVSFITVHGRWIIEKARNNYYIEARRKNVFFYNNYVNSGDVPDHAKEYKRETRFFRTLLKFPEEKCDKKILLFVPKPKSLVYSEAKLDYLTDGSVVNGAEIMFADKFFETY